MGQFLIALPLSATNSGSLMSTFDGDCGGTEFSSSFNGSLEVGGEQMSFEQISKFVVSGNLDKEER